MAEQLQGSSTPNTNSIGQDSVLHLPPSNLEVKIRTMETDIESVKKGGGLLGIAEKISFSIPKEVQPMPQGVSAGTEEVIKKKSNLGLYAGLGAVGVLVLFALGYFLPQILNSTPVTPTPPPVATGSTPAAPGPAGTGTTPIVTPVTSTPIATELPKSFFNASGTPVIAVTFLPGLGKDYWTSSIKNGAPASFSELFALDSAGSKLAFNNLLDTLGVALTNENIFTANFLPDYGAYLFRVGTGYYPGFVFKLKPDAIGLLVKNDLLKIEQENSFIQGLFLDAPGTRAASFGAGQVAAGQMRELQFSVKPNAFVYGLFNSYLVIGTSEEGVTAAISKL